MAHPETSWVPVPRNARSSKGISRRTLLKGAVAGISYPALAAFLSACGNDGGTAAGEAASASATGVAELRIPIHESPWLASFEEIARIYEEQTGTRINLRVFPYDGLRTQQIQAVTTGGEAFDLFTIDSSWVGQFFDQGWVTPLAEIDDGFSWPQDLIEYDSVARWDPEQRMTLPDAPVMGIPINGNMHLFMYRRDLFEDLGLDVPATWREAIANGEAAGDAVEYGYVVRGQPADAGTSITFDFGPLLHSHGGDWFADPGTDWTPTINDAAAVEAMRTFQALAALGPADPQSIGQTEMLSLLQAGRALQCHMVAAVYPHLDNEEESSVPDLVDYAVVPAGSGDPSPLIGAWTQSIPVHIPDERKRAAYEFLTWIVDAEVQRQYAEAGGIVTNQTVYDSDLPEQDEFRYMRALGESSQYARRSLIYPFSQEMAEVTERSLADILSGQVEIQPGLDQIAQELERIVQEAGYT
jgi:multiple sugar transport system substrate-binding protein